jgi:hypothetical protein
VHAHPIADSVRGLTLKQSDTTKCELFSPKYIHLQGAAWRRSASSITAIFIRTPPGRLDIQMATEGGDFQ